MFTIRVLNWNVEWNKPDTPKGVLVQQRLCEVDADVICLTEGLRPLFSSSGHVITSDSDYGYPIKGPDHRKVSLWSRNPWEDVDTLGSLELPSGRFVSGVTQTDCGLVRFVAICIPWGHAHVSTGRRDKTLWEDHSSYLEALSTVLARLSSAVPCVVVGDFNQRIPRRRVPKRTYELMMQTFEGWDIETQGEILGLEKASVDHIALRPPLTCDTVWGIPRTHPDGSRLSDHDSVVAEIHI